MQKSLYLKSKTIQSAAALTETQRSEGGRGRYLYQPMLDCTCVKL